MSSLFQRLTRPIRAVVKATTFFLKVFPMLPSRPVDWVTKTLVIEKVRYGSISEKVFIDINGVKQGIFIKGKNTNNPVLL